MARHKKTEHLIAAAAEVLSELRPMTLRQVYYQLVSRQVIPNAQAQYNRLGRALVDARRDGVIPWDWIEDRTRTPRTPPAWNSPEHFGQDVVQQYRRAIWKTQSIYLEVWVEKDALSGIFQEITEDYGITLAVARGYPSASSLYETARRMSRYSDKPAIIQYYGDHDPSGMDMGRNLVDGLAGFDCRPKFVRCALNIDDIERYNLPHDFAKKTDTRARAFIANHGNIAVELDALPVNVLRKRITAEIEARLDLDALEELRSHEKHERGRLHNLIGKGSQ